MSLFAFHCCDKHHDYQHLEEDRVYFMLHFIFDHERQSEQEHGSRNVEARAEARGWPCAAYRPVLHGLLSTLACAAEDHPPRGGIT